MRRFISTLAFVIGFSLSAASLSSAVGTNSGSGSSGKSSGSSYGSSSSGYGGSSSRSKDRSTNETDDIDAMISRAQDYNERGWFQRSVGLLRQATQLDPFNADAWNELGFAYRNIENYERSARAYDRALRLEPEHLGALNYQGFMFLETDNPDGARSNLAQLGELCGTCAEYQTLKDAIDGL